jgi:hypothetical protein
MRSLALVALLGFAPAVPVHPQAGPPETPKPLQLKMLEHQRKILLAMADSMPERLYRDKATPAQRDFAQQVHHAASAAAYIISTTMGGAKVSLPDTAAVFSGKTGLRSYVNGVFDYAVSTLNAQTAQARSATANLLGQSMPRAQIWDEIYAHTVWTTGQIVANFRKNGMAPPAFTFF